MNHRIRMLIDVVVDLLTPLERWANKSPKLFRHAMIPGYPRDCSLKAHLKRRRQASEFDYGKRRRSRNLSSIHMRRWGRQLKSVNIQSIFSVCPSKRMNIDVYWISRSHINLSILCCRAFHRHLFHARRLRLLSIECIPNWLQLRGSIPQFWLDAVGERSAINSETFHTAKCLHSRSPHAAMRLCNRHKLKIHQRWGNLRLVQLKTDIRACVPTKKKSKDPWNRKSTTASCALAAPQRSLLFSHIIDKLRFFCASLCRQLAEISLENVKNTEKLFFCISVAPDVANAVVCVWHTFLYQHFFFRLLNIRGAHSAREKRNQK